MKTKNKKPKFTVVVFYGFIAAGKYTTAKEFHKQSGYKFFHNHNTIDIAREVFDRNSESFDRLITTLRLEVFKEIARAKVNVVTTHTYAHNYISDQGLSDPAYMKKIQSIIEKGGGCVYFVHLSALENVLMERVVNNSRRKLVKLVDRKIMKEKLAKYDIQTTAPVRNNIEIDNTKLSPKQVVKKVLEIISARGENF